MKVARSFPDRIELSGVPHLGFALLGGLVVCPVLATGVGYFLSVELQRSKGAWLDYRVILLGVTLVCVAAVWLLCGALMCRRERLVLDRVTRKGEHSTGWVFGARDKVRAFSLDDIHSVTLEHYKGSGGGNSMPVAQVRSRLLLVKPRRVIVLEDSESGMRGRVRPVAEAVAAWLRVEVMVKGKEGD